MSNTETIALSEVPESVASRKSRLWKQIRKAAKGGRCWLVTLDGLAIPVRFVGWGDTLEALQAKIADQGLKAASIQRIVPDPQRS